METADDGKIICGALKHGTQEKCRNKPEPGRTRCKFHGGAATGQKNQEGNGYAIKHGLYAQRRRDNFAKMGIPQDVFDSIPAVVDLTEEIVTARANLERFEQLLAKGEKFIYSDPKGKAYAPPHELDDGAVRQDEMLGGTRVALSVEDLYQRQKDLLRRLLKTQQEIRPGGDIGGNLRFHITVSAGAVSAAGDAVPLLTEEESDTPPEDVDSDPLPSLTQSVPPPTGYEE